MRGVRGVWECVFFGGGIGVDWGWVSEGRCWLGAEGLHAVFVFLFVCVCLCLLWVVVGW